MEDEDRKYYVYIYLDPRKPGDYVYGDYKFKNEPFYVGKGKNKRYKEHLTDARSMKKDGTYTYIDHRCSKIRKIKEETDKDPIIKKIKTNLSEDLSFQLEIGLIKLIGRDDLNNGPLVNKTDGGEGFSGYVPTEEQIEANRIRNTGENHPNWGKCISEETKKKISEAHMGMQFSEEHLKNLSLSHMGKPQSEETRRKRGESLRGENHHFYGKTFSDEHKKKLSITQTGKKLSEETKRKIAESSRGRTYTKETRMKISKVTSKPISINGKKYPSITHASKTLNIPDYTIQYRLKTDKYSGYEYIDKKEL